MESILLDTYGGVGVIGVGSKLRLAFGKFEQIGSEWLRGPCPENNPLCQEHPRVHPMTIGLKPESVEIVEKTNADEWILIGVIGSRRIRVLPIV